MSETRDTKYPQHGRTMGHKSMNSAKWSPTDGPSQPNKATSSPVGC